MAKLTSDFSDFAYFSSSPFKDWKKSKSNRKINATEKLKTTNANIFTLLHNRLKGRLQKFSYCRLPFA